MKKQVIISLHDGRNYGIDADEIARDKAYFFYGDDDEMSYLDEYTTTIESDEMLREWITNKKDWYNLNHSLISHDTIPLKDAYVKTIGIRRVL